MAAGIMPGLFLLLLCLPAVLAISSQFCPSSYTVSVHRSEQYTVSCPWRSPGRCLRTRYFIAYETRINSQECCRGYRGTACNIAVCEPECANSGICVRPDVCDCPAGRVGATCTTHDAWHFDIIVGIVVGGIVFLVLVLIIALVLIRLKTNKPLPGYLDRAARSIIIRLSRTPNDTMELGHNQPVPNAHTCNNPDMGGNTANVSRPRSKADDDDIYASGEVQTDRSATWKHSEDKVFFGKTIVVGRFAEIKMATLVSDGVKTNVVAKMLPAGRSEEDVLLMKAKMNFMAEGLGKHRNLVHFEGAVTDGALAPIILLEHCDMGLRDWLKSHNSTTSGLEDELAEFCLGIARAVEYLHSHEILHRRLGTRNVLLKAVGDTLIPKVTGFGPMKGEQEGQSAQETKESQIPVKWMAPEQIGLRYAETRPYTKMTDTWSYGITMWEIYSNGDAPYGQMTNNDAIMFVKDGNRLGRPPVCSDIMFHVMMSCWVDNPDRRMTLAAVRSTFENLFHNSGQSDYYGSDMYRLGGTEANHVEEAYSNRDLYSLQGAVGN